MTASRRRHPPLASILACLLLIAATTSADDESAPQAQPETPMTQQARGTFDVEMNPRQPTEGEPASIGRMVLDKQYHGDLEATGHGQMLAHRTSVDGSAGYVAMEVVEGTLGGRSGTFVLQHSGIMNRGEASLTLLVVPDSGTEELEGLTGSMEILIENDEHRYELEYSQP